MNAGTTTRRTTTRRRRAVERREQLIDTALTVFAQKGVQGATVKDLAEAAGVAPGLMYHYFRSKEDLLRAALERRYFMPELRRRLAEATGRPASEVLSDVAIAFAAMLGENRALVRVVFQEALLANPLVAERVERGQREAIAAMTAYLQSRVATGELRPHDAAATARLLLFAVLMAHFTGTAGDAFLPAAVDTIVHGLLAS
jgi:TetR/AcrR family transcriptional regulator, cholesterol catabolism regulator